jgi:7,8-dihydropterin-6-yl-methyl-4-(beta-D-ribofuranosyl)aminobenzene 5'-phosphate synthase
MPNMKSTLGCRVWYAALVGLLICSPVAAADPPANSITVISSHQMGKSKAEVLARGGLSMYVMVNGKAILFDTGAEDSPLLKNIKELGLDATLIDAIVFSHSQSDRVHGEMPDVLNATSSKAKVYVPASAAEAVSQKKPGANVVLVSKPTRVLPDAWLVGPMHLESEGGATVQQALVLDRPDGLIVIIGCSFPGVASAVQQVKEVFGHRRIQLVAGGFHLRGTSKDEIRELSLKLQQKGIKGLALSNCTGEPALKIFRQEWGDRVVSLDFGNPIRF